MSKKKPIKTEWKQDDRRDLDDWIFSMTKEEMKEVEKKFREALMEELKNQNKDE